MKYVFFTLFSLLLATNSHSQPNTKVTIQTVIDQYSQTCKPLAQEMFQYIKLSAAAFNAGDYANADGAMYITRNIIKDLMVSDKCNIDDLKRTMEYSNQLQPMRKNIICMIRLTETQQHNAIAFQHLENFEFTQALFYAQKTQAVLNEVINNKICANMPPKFQEKIVVSRENHNTVVEKLSKVIND